MDPFNKANIVAKLDNMDKNLEYLELHDLDIHGQVIEEILRVCDNIRQNYNRDKLNELSILLKSMVRPSSEVCKSFSNDNVSETCVSEIDIVTRLKSIENDIKCLSHTFDINEETFGDIIRTINKIQTKHMSTFERNMLHEMLIE